jgi:hypothetical protein
VVSLDSYFLLGLGVRDVTFCYFLLLAVILGKLLFTVETGERVHLDYFLFLFTVEGEGGGGVCFFFWPIHMICALRS